jgi:hypothetical protein
MADGSPTLREIRVVLETPRKLLRKRKAVDDAHLEYVLAKNQFISTPTPPAWSRLVTAASRWHAETKRVEKGGA